MSDRETQELTGICRNSLYLYKRELKEEIERSSIEKVIKYYNDLSKTYKEKNK